MPVSSSARLWHYTKLILKHRQPSAMNAILPGSFANYIPVPIQLFPYIDFTHTNQNPHNLRSVGLNLLITEHVQSFVTLLQFSQHYILPRPVSPFTWFFSATSLNSLSLLTPVTAPFFPAHSYSLKIKGKIPWIFYDQWYDSPFSDGINIQSPCLISKYWFLICDLRNAAVWGAGNEVRFYLVFVPPTTTHAKNCQLLSKGIYYFDNKATYSGLRYTSISCCVQSRTSVRFSTNNSPLPHTHTATGVTTRSLSPHITNNSNKSCWLWIY